jgi:hypothetical protein
VVCATLLFAVLLPAVALARRLANSHQHAAVVAAAVAAHDINRPQGRCARVFISTANTSWASLDFPAATSGKPKDCLALSANGVSIFHFRRGKWHFVTSGSSFLVCPPKGVPKSVAKDLRVC